MFELIKFSSPGWSKYYETLSETIDELRTHICESCLLQDESARSYFDLDGNLIEVESGDDFVVDVIYDGVRYNCRNWSILLGTSCGCEYGIHEDDKPLSRDKYPV